MCISYKKYIRDMSKKYGLVVKYSKSPNPIGCLIKTNNGVIVCDYHAKENLSNEEAWNRLWIDVAFEYVYKLTNEHPFFYKK